MAYIILIAPNIYEARTSTLRMFGGKLYITTDIKDAKRLTRKTDALKRVKLLNAHANGSCAYKKEFQPNINSINAAYLQEV